MTTYFNIIKINKIAPTNYLVTIEHFSNKFDDAISRKIAYTLLLLILYYRH